MRNIPTTRKALVGACAALAAALLFCPPSPSPLAATSPRPLQGSEQFDIVYHITATAALDLWDISKPNVRRMMTEYPQITFREGDRVTVTANGCVQTGGKGDTWKRYIDPKGPNADRLYHGLVWVPGATAGLVRIKDVLGKPLAIPFKADIPHRLYLRLGYEDNDYGDNGYWSPDNGTYDQCKNTGPVVVTVRIEHPQ
jgi:hypothetical protein